ncbi:MAG TPA: hypothetical protein VHH34_24545, partial [Pseudonocardiaceae bacterium]|nr:hypothetical protein [Pseudonocardiaceae bacterium]
MDTEALLRAAGSLRDRRYGTRLTYSPKVFLPLTMLCRDRCGYCTFAHAPRELPAAYLALDEVRGRTCSTRSGPGRAWSAAGRP